jgi:hypothetical protein
MKQITYFLLVISYTALAQIELPKKFTFQGYGEVYYNYNFNNKTAREHSGFLYSHKKLNQPNLNLAFVKANYQSKRLRGNVALMAGDYSTYNLSAEPNWAKPILEANLGVKMSSTKNIWLDAGVMPSHIGFESAISADCWTLTRSILAENSPYFETGLKLSYTSPSEKWNVAALVLNGWQRIQFPSHSKNPAYGFQFNYKPKANLQLNYSNFIGYNLVEDYPSMRLFHNLYAVYEPTEKWGFTFGLDAGTDRAAGTSYDAWYSPVAITRITWNKKIRTVFRAEYYSDKNQLIISTTSPRGIQLLGLSSNLDYQVAKKWLWRLEAKNFQSNELLFGPAKSNFFMTTSLAVKL